MKRESLHKKAYPKVKTTSIITASYLPERVITNQDIVDAGLKATPIAIERGLGVRERRAAAPDETAADMMLSLIHI